MFTHTKHFTNYRVTNLIIERRYLRLMQMDRYNVAMQIRVYGQFSIETIHERRKRNREFVLLIRIGKQNVKIIEKIS